MQCSFSLSVCLCRFYKPHTLEKHLTLCGQNEPCRITFPSKKIKVRKGKDTGIDTSGEGDGKENDAEEGCESIEEHMGIDADVRWEMELKEAIADGLKPDNILCYTQQMNEFQVPFAIYADFESYIGEGDVHLPSGFCTFVVSSFDFLNNEHPYTYSGPDVMKHFFDHLDSLRNRLNATLGLVKPMTTLTRQQQQRHDNATKCNTCGLEFIATN